MKILGKQSVEDQYKYWQKKHHTLFGSTSSRIHLHESESSEYKRLCSYIQENNNRENLSSSHVKNYRCIKYTSIDLTILPNNITEKINNNKSVKKIVAELNYCSFLKDLPGGPNCSTNTIVPPVSIISEKAKKIIKATFFRSI